MSSMPATHAQFAALRQQIVGIHTEVPLLDGSARPYVYLDNAASTPALRGVQDKLNDYLPWYSSVHRGSGFKSLLSTHVYEQARAITLRFVGADEAGDCAIFTKNTSEAINRLAAVMSWQPGDVVLSTVMEHHSNDLPWRAHAAVEHVGVTANGALDMDDLADRLRRLAGRVRVVAVTGASNVSGWTPPIYDIAELAHAHGALLVADCAQLAPHRAIHMGQPGTARRLDFVAISAHKMYAPFGGGALIGPKAFFDGALPDYRGGGTVEIVTLDDVVWTGAPERNEPGSPNVPGAIALAASMEILAGVGMAAIAAHERELTAYALRKLARLPDVHVYGPTEPRDLDDRVGVISFSVAGLTHGVVAAILGFEGGIGVRNGCFCAHPYILRLLGISDAEYADYRARVLDHNRGDLPGLVRMSFGCYNNTDEVDHFVATLARICARDYRGEYALDRASGSYYPTGFDPAISARYFSL